MRGAILKSAVRRGVFRAVGRALYQVMPCRCRRRGLPECGRFMKSEVRTVLMRAGAHVRELEAHVRDYARLGNYQKHYEGVVTLAVYRALTEAGVDRDYAVEILGDAMWQTVLNMRGFVPVVGPLVKALVNLAARDPHDALGMLMRIMRRYPYSEPGYRVEFFEKDRVYHWNVRSCPSYEFHRQFGAEEMTVFRRLWCTLDYAVAEHAVRGGRYQREHCLADGDDVCDMRWSVDGKRGSIRRSG